MWVLLIKAVLVWQMCFDISGKGFLAELQSPPILSLGTHVSPTLHCLPQCFVTCLPSVPFPSLFLLNSGCLWDPPPSASRFKDKSREGASEAVAFTVGDIKTGTTDWLNLHPGGGYETFTREIQQEKHVNKNAVSCHEPSLSERIKTSPVTKVGGENIEKGPWGYWFGKWTWCQLHQNEKWTQDYQVHRSKWIALWFYIMAPYMDSFVFP